MNKKIIFGLMIVVLLVFATGCSFISKRGTTPSQKGEPISKWDVDFRSGTKGLTMEFLSKQPPDQVYEGASFNLMLRLKNDGAATISEGCYEDVQTPCPGLLYISGFDTNTLLIGSPQHYIGMNIGDEGSQALAGKNEFNPEGEFNIKTIPVTAKEVTGGDRVETFTVSACYLYKTMASFDVCINPNLLDLTDIDDIGCKPKTVSKSGGQGGPVAVTKVEQEFIPLGDKTKVLFKIHIKNSGGGRVVKQEAFAYTCKEGYSLDPITQSDVIMVRDVRFSIYSLATEKLTCNKINKTNKYIQIPTEGTLELTCTADIEGSDSYMTPLVVELTYGYNDQISKTIIVKDIDDS